MKKSALFLPPIILALIFTVLFIIFNFNPAVCAETGEVKTVFIKDGESFDFIYIPAGSFLMGSDLSDADRDQTEWPAHTVKISRGFWLLKNEVTQSQWQSVMKSNPSYFKNRSDAGNEDSPLDNPGGDTQKYHSGRDNCPVEKVSWYDCEKFIAALNSKEVGVFRLPSEAEWEYACRAETQTSYYWGDSIDEKYFWYMDNAYNKPQAVCSKLPNKWGLYDMSGNMSEWCADWGKSPHDRSGETVCDPKGEPAGEYKVVRDGNWAIRAVHSRSARRSLKKPDDKDMYTGFRIVWEPAVK